MAAARRATWPPVAALRTWVGRVGPLNASCPRCRCNKSGHIHEPNARTEACEDTWCPCHTAVA